jgi:outer membrane protein OmpA-like peptidoglycan-associated protein
MFRVACVIAAGLFALQAGALNYTPRVDEAEWRLQKSELECRLWQPIPRFGNAVFNKKAGERAVFELSGNQPAVASGKAMLVAMAPDWRADIEPVSLGEVDVSGSIVLGAELTARLLAGLQQGLSPTFSSLHWFEQDHEVSVGVSAVNFRAAFTDYQACMADMLPVGLADIQRSRVEFANNSVKLTREAKSNLDLVARYLQADPDISSCVIDGHTDDTGHARYNLGLSKKRAEAVAAYLVSQGVPESKLTTRYHGERFPVNKNTDEASRQKNRRVTLRLE